MIDAHRRRLLQRNHIILTCEVTASCNTAYYLSMYKRMNSIAGFIRCTTNCATAQSREDWIRTNNTRSICYMQYRLLSVVKVR